MHRIQRIVFIAVLIAAAPVLSGCADFDMDKLDVFGLNEKKKLPGDRKPLFPEGVPGVQQGIPEEYRLGRQKEIEAAQAAEVAKATEAVNAPAAEEKPKAAPKPKRAAQTASKPTRVNISPRPQQRPVQQQPAQQQPAQQQPPAAWPEPAQQTQQQPAQQSPWPSPQQSQSSTAPWPSAPPPGTFSR